MSSYLARAPALDDDAVRALLAELYGLRAGRVTALDGYDDRNYLLRDVTKIDKECHGDVEEKDIVHGCVIKITAPAQAAIANLTTMQMKVMQHAHARGIPCSTILPQKDGQMCTDQCFGDDLQLPVRLLNFIPGRMMRGIPVTQHLVHQIGQLVARYTMAMQDLDALPFFDDYTHAWSMSEVHECRRFLPLFDDTQKREKLAEAIDVFVDRFAQVKDSLKYGIIHSDMNEGNMVVDDSPSPSLVGLIDFGDIVRAPQMFEWSTAVLYFTLEAMAPNSQVSCRQVGRSLLAGYSSVDGAPSITPMEMSMARPAVLGRLAQSLAYGHAASVDNPSNIEYVAHTQKTGWKLMDHLLGMDDEQYARELNQGH